MVRLSQPREDSDDRVLQRDKTFHFVRMLEALKAGVSTLQS